MSRLKRPLGFNVLIAAQRRIATVFDRFERVYVSFSAGKDSTVLLHLAACEARRRGRRLGVLLIDLEAQYAATITHALACVDLHREVIDLYWIALPLNLRNAVSQFHPQWMAWDPAARSIWVRQPPACAITDPSALSFYREGMEFEDFVERFALWYGDGHATVCLVGIRSDESLNRFRTLIQDKRMLDRLRWTTWIGDGVYNAYPLYDWRVSDIWVYSTRSALPQNPIYDLMTKAGVPPSLQRICQPYGDDQRRGLWLFHLLEPDTWPLIVARVSGANGGALYARERGAILGNGKVALPTGHSWRSYVDLLLMSMPVPTAAHYREKIDVFLQWWTRNGYVDGIPDEADPRQEAAKKMPSWRRIAKTLLKNDYWCKGLTFSPPRTGGYQHYLAVKAARKSKWKASR